MDNKITFYQKYPLICLSSINSESLLFPVDNIKTKMQYHNTPFYHTLRKSISNQGIMSLYKGFAPSVLRHWTYSGLKICLYEDLRERLYDQGVTKEQLLPKVILGGFCGGVSQMIANPFDLFKIRSIIYHEPIKEQIYKTYHTKGLRGFFIGTTPNVCKAVTVNIGEIAVYDYSKQQILAIRNKEDFLTYSGASGISGLVSSLLCTPFDTIRTRIMTQHNVLVYKSLTDCLIKIVQKEGFSTLYTGFLPNWFRLAPWQLIFWNSYEFYLKSFNYESF